METPVAPVTPETPATAAHAPYSEPVSAYEVRSELYGHFHDFDNKDIYDKYLVETIDKNTANFAVRFGADKARIATNLKGQDVTTLLDFDLEKREEDNLPVTWM